MRPAFGNQSFTNSHLSALSNESSSGLFLLKERQRLRGGVRDRHCCWPTQVRHSASIRSLTLDGVISSPSAQDRGRLSFVLRQGGVTANKWTWVSAEAQPLSRGRFCRPSEVRPISFGRRRSTAAAPASKGSVGFCLEPALDCLTWNHGLPG